MSGPLALRFLREGGQSVSEIAGSLASFLASARRDVAIAIYDFHFEHEDGQVIARTLQGLRDRGVRVRIVDHDERESVREVADNVPRPAAPIEYVDSLGLDVQPVIGFGTLMHHKYAVIDGERVWTGSMNWTEDSFTLQENCVVTLESALVAAAYLRDFESLWERPRHLEKSGRFDVEWSDATFEGQPVRVRPSFCPGRGPELAALIGTRIGTARERVLICSPVLTSGPILGALSDVVGRGVVPVTGVIDRTQMQDVLRQWGSLPKASWKPAAFRFVASHAHFGGKRSIPWGPETVHDFLHAKLVVCDDWAFIGSYNHSRAGEENAENVLAIDGKAVADLVAEEIRGFAETYAPAPGDSWLSAPA
ncbi:MAG TPA: phospholipase D-like domain-containing protein [Gaiellales bacterium]|nr:phospholipase D-like domain-containing protein [Gaiellales bacterium]